MLGVTKIKLLSLLGRIVLACVSHTLVCLLFKKCLSSV